MGLLDTIRDLAHAAKDAGASFVVERAIAHRLQPYGRMLNLSIDSKTKRIRLEVLLQGESEPITITIDEYEVATAAGADFILVKKASASREWMNALLQDFALGKKIPLPAKYASMVKSLL
jgi:hypothetical protein